MLSGDYSSPTLPNLIATGVHICTIEEDSQSLLKPNATGWKNYDIEEQLTVCKTHPSSDSSRGARGVLGIGIDSETGMFQASDEWWAKMESTNKACAKFRKKILEHRDLMETVFIGASAIGKHHWTPGEKVQEVDNVSFDSVDSLGTQPFADPIPARAVDVDSDSSLEFVPTVNDKRKRMPSTSCGKLKKAASGASVITKSMNNLTNVVRIQNQQVTVKHLTGNESLYTISECMHRLRNILVLLSTPLFHYALVLMDNADYCEVMIC